MVELCMLAEQSIRQRLHRPANERYGEVLADGGNDRQRQQTVTECAQTGDEDSRLATEIRHGKPPEFREALANRVARKTYLSRCSGSGR